VIHQQHINLDGGRVQLRRCIVQLVSTQAAIDIHVDFFQLAHPQIGGTVKAVTLLDKGMHHLKTQGLGQFAQFGQRGGKLHIADFRQLNRRHNGVSGFIFDFCFFHELIASLYFGWRARILPVNAPPAAQIAASLTLQADG
jgi:hypothetical protein